MKEQDFNQAIAAVVIAFEKAGVYTPELKATIDGLFELKEVIKISEVFSKESGSCMTCSFMDKDETCSFFSATIGERVNIELFPPGTKNRLKIQVPLNFRCKFYKA